VLPKLERERDDWKIKTESCCCSIDHLTDSLVVMIKECHQLRKVVDELADALKLEMNTGFSCRELRAYNQLPHVQERNKSK
jgi:hypothetical protein